MANVAFQKAYRVIKDSQLRHSVLSFYYAYRLSNALTNTNHQKVIKTARQALFFGCKTIAHYFLAESYFLCGKYDLATNNILSIKNFQNIPEVVFLYADILVKQHHYIKARQILFDLAKNHPRKKVWIYLSNLVQTPEDYTEFESYINIVKEQTNYLKDDELHQPRINACMRAGLDDKAIVIAKSAKKSFVEKKGDKQNFSLTLGKQALSDVKKILNSADIEFFLVSGTLLGCVRNGSLLSHDKDLDIGVWDSYDYDVLESLLGTSGCFYIVPTRTRHVITVRHVNGVMVDVFIHYREPNDYWHAGVKLKWHNTPFELMPYVFLGDSYLIPKNYDLYLQENYGEWRVPKIKFDSAFDTTNAEVINEVEMLIYQFKSNNR